MSKPPTPEQGKLGPLLFSEEPITTEDLQATIRMAWDRSEYYRSMYEALAAGIDDEGAINSAKLMVASAHEVAQNTGRNLREVFTLMLEFMYKSRAISYSKRKKRRR